MHVCRHVINYVNCKSMSVCMVCMYVKRSDYASSSSFFLSNCGSSKSLLVYDPSGADSRLSFNKLSNFCRPYSQSNVSYSTYVQCIYTHMYMYMLADLFLSPAGSRHQVAEGRRLARLNHSETKLQKTYIHTYIIVFYIK